MSSVRQLRSVVPFRLGRPATLLLVGWLFSASLAVAQPGYHEVREMPEGPLGARLQQVLDAVNTGDTEARHAAVRQLLETAFAPSMRDAVPLEQHLQVFDGVHQASRGLDFHGMRVYDDPTGLPPGDVAVVRNRLTGGWQAVVLELEESEPHRIVGLGFPPARPPADLPPGPRLTRDRLGAELEDYVDRLADADAFSGAVLLAQGEDVVFRAARGQASRRFSVPNDLDTLFNLGSMNKMFTAVVVLQLAEEGVLSLGDPLSKHLGADWIGADVAERVRIEHLLTHTSGLGSYFGDDFFAASRDRFREVGDYRELVAGESLAHAPGERWSYSNTGYLLLGAVIEAVTGKNYFDVVRERIYEPAGMERSGSWDMDEPVPNLAIGYHRVEGAWRNNLYLHVIRGGPAGGGFSTVGDLHRFARALLDGTLLPAEILELATTPKPDLGSPDYGYGFGVEEEGAHRIFGHTGGFPGINASLDIDPDSGWIAVVLSNVSQGAMPVRQRIRELLQRLED